MFRVELNPRLGRQVLFLFALMLFGLLLLAWRSEYDRHRLTEGLWDNCQYTAQQVDRYNDGLADAYYAAVVAQQLSITGQAATPAQQEQQRVLADALADRLHFPVFNCGPDPRS